MRPDVAAVGDGRSRSAVQRQYVDLVFSEQGGFGVIDLDPSLQYPVLGVVALFGGVDCAARECRGDKKNEYG